MGRRQFYLLKIAGVYGHACDLCILMLPCTQIHLSSNDVISPPPSFLAAKFLSLVLETARGPPTFPSTQPSIYPTVYTAAAIADTP